MSAELGFALAVCSIVVVAAMFLAVWIAGYDEEECNEERSDQVD